MAICGFYRRKRVLLTGLTGFKGLWLAAWLERLGADVTGLALPVAADMLRGWPGLAERFRCEIADVRDAAAVERAFRAARPEVVFHLAAQPLVRLSYQAPVETFATNVLGTVHVLEAARQAPSVGAVVCVTSDKCYENREWVWGYREDEPLGGHDPDRASKGCAELVAAAYRRSFAPLPVASARAGNVIGGGDWAADRIVPDLVRSIVAGEPVVLRRPLAVRPWQHVLEALSGYLLLAERVACGGPGFASAWNFGPLEAEMVTVRDLAREMVRLWGRGQVVEAADAAGPHEARYLRLDPSKAVADLGWRPLLTAAERLSWTVEWYRAWADDAASVWGVTAEQIERYEGRIAGCTALSTRWSPGSPDSSAPRSHAA
jgi:CDP-glucose 4,6-dehydratase